MVTFRLRAACGAMCSIPMLRKSPSPATTTTFKSGLPIFTPSEMGRARPWMPWKPNGCSPSNRCTRLPEQPMPATTTLFAIGVSYFTM